MITGYVMSAAFVFETCVLHDGCEDVDVWVLGWRCYSIIKQN